MLLKLLSHELLQNTLKCSLSPSLHFFLDIIYKKKTQFILYSLSRIFAVVVADVVVVVLGRGGVVRVVFYYRQC